MNLGVLASGEGTTLQALIDAYTDKSGVMIAVVLSNNSGAGSLRRAKAANIPAFHLSNRTHSSPEELDSAICSVLQAHHVDLVILTGYMKKLGALTLAAFEYRIVNTHPSLLPRFAGKGMFGLNVHQAVLNAHETVTGASVHLVTEEYDAGPIIGQRKVRVDPGDTPESLADRVQSCERELLIEIVTLFSKDESN
jgi:phosphoribosylglycinamide formyltransferase 1